jgi:hypothetical protein
MSAAVPAAKGAGQLSWQHVVAEAWHSALAMVITYVITLSIFPVSKEAEGADSNSAWPAMQCEHWE